jgi:hypothetical protein
MWQKFSNFFPHFYLYGRNIAVGIASRNGLGGLGIESQGRGIFCARPDRASCNGYRVFPGLGVGGRVVNQPGPGADHQPRLLSQGC